MMHFDHSSFRSSCIVIASGSAKGPRLSIPPTPPTPLVVDTGSCVPPTGKWRLSVLEVKSSGMIHHILVSYVSLESQLLVCATTAQSAEESIGACDYRSIRWTRDATFREAAFSKRDMHQPLFCAKIRWRMRFHTCKGTTRRRTQYSFTFHSFRVTLRR